MKNKTVTQLIKAMQIKALDAIDHACTDYDYIEKLSKDDIVEIRTWLQIALKQVDTLSEVVDFDESMVD